MVPRTAPFDRVVLLARRSPRSKTRETPAQHVPVDADKSWLMKCELRTQNQRICLREAKGTVVAGLSLDKIRQPDPESQKAFVFLGLKFFGG